jgi:hypothetical protein
MRYFIGRIVTIFIAAAAIVAAARFSLLPQLDWGAGQKTSPFSFATGG